MPLKSDPAKADAVQAAIDTYTKHYNLTPNAQASAEQIQATRTQFLDQVGAPIGWQFNSKGLTRRSTWEKDLLKDNGGVRHHAPGKLKAVKKLNERFKALAEQRVEQAEQRVEQAVEKTVENYANWLNDNASASAEQIKARRTQFLNQVGTHIGLQFHSEGLTRRSTWEDDLLKEHSGVGSHAPGQLQTVRALNKQFKEAAKTKKSVAVDVSGQGFSAQTPVQGSSRQMQTQPELRTQTGPVPLRKQSETFAEMVRRRTEENRHPSFAVHSPLTAPQSLQRPHSTAPGQPNQPSAPFGYQLPPPDSRVPLSPLSSIAHALGSGSSNPYAYDPRPVAGQNTQAGPPDLHPPVPVRRDPLPTINSVGDITYLGKVKNGLSGLVKSIEEGDDAKRDALWQQVSKSDMAYSVDIVEELIRSAQSRVKSLIPTNTEQKEFLEEIERDLKSNYNTIQNVIKLQSSRRAQTPHPSQVPPALARLQSYSRQQPSHGRVHSVLPQSPQRPTLPQAYLQQAWANQPQAPAETTLQRLRSQPPSPGNQSHGYGYRQ
jgi:hypothetical protein